MASITLKFLRAGAVVCAADEMRDNNDTPVQFLKSTNPDPRHDHLFADSDMWDNFVRTKWRFFIHYCAHEGLVMSMDLAEAVKYYIFFGTYHFSRTIRKQKTMTTKPVLHAIHNILTQHRSRFVPLVETHFKTFIDLVHKNPQWKGFFDDFGVANVPLAYLIAIEEGLRSFCFMGNPSLTMGFRNISSATMWGTKVKAWRKLEAYITVIRKISGRVII